METLSIKISRLDKIIATVEAGLANVAKTTAQLNSLMSSLDAQTITYSSLEHAPYYLPVPLDQGVISYRIPAPEGLITFVVTFQNKTLLRKHQHDCKKLIFRLAGDLWHKKAPVTSALEIPPGQEHLLTSPTGSLLVIHFEKP